MFCGKMKAFTLGFDDGVIQDRRLVSILNKYGIKCTFFLNSERFGCKSERDFDGVVVDTSRVDESEVRELYRGHEIASHTLTHPSLATIPIEEAERQVVIDCENLAKISEYDITGLAYPCGSVNDEVIKMLREKTDVKYARWNGESLSFEPPTELLKLNYTARFTNDVIFDLAREFIDLKPETPKIFSIFGHAYEFDAFSSWDRLEEFCRLISGHDDIYYACARDCFLKGE